MSLFLRCNQVGWLRHGRKFCPLFRARAPMRTPDERPWHRTDHLQRHGRRDRDRRQLLQGSRLCRMARAGSEANLDRGPHHPRQNIEAGQSLPARPVRAGGMGRSCKSETDQMARPRAQALAKKRLHHNVLAMALPTSSRASRGAFLLTVGPSRRTSVRLLRDCSRVIELPARRGLREDETRWRFGLPGACEHW